jgi:2-(1,2-epoxy-1,2-dihydrophenyl)acetyl-CoA isomerase
MSNGIGYDVTGGVATITLDRPDALNALVTEMKVALLDVLGQIRSDSTVRAVLLTGAGRAFCAGQDLREIAADLAAGTTDLSTVTEHYNPIIAAPHFRCRSWPPSTAWRQERVRRWPSPVTSGSPPTTQPS